jgi:hypothetical protein
MNNTNTGGPAFPVDEGALIRNLQGMTLRDYFAAKAMQSLIRSAPNGTTFGASSDSTYAFASYAVADAMIKARDEK